MLPREGVSDPRWQALGLVDDTSQYDELLKDAAVIDLGPGDAFVCPSGWWWYETAGAGLTAHVDVYVNEHGDEARFLRDAMVRQLSADAQPVLSFSISPEAKQADEALAFTAQAKEALEAAELAETAAELWGSFVSAFGFRAVPEHDEDAAVELEDEIAGEPLFPIVLLRHGDDMTVAANGHAFALGYSHTVDALVTALNRGEPRGVEELLAELTGDDNADADADTCTEVLAALASFRAVRRC